MSSLRDCVMEDIALGVRRGVRKIADLRTHSRRHEYAENDKRIWILKCTRWNPASSELSGLPEKWIAPLSIMGSVPRNPG